MAKFMLIKISLMAEITDADALREAALKNFDAADMTSADHPDTAEWHASEEGQEERRQVATQDRDALTQFVDPAKACEMLDGVPGVKCVPPGLGPVRTGGHHAARGPRRLVEPRGDYMVARARLGADRLTPSTQRSRRHSGGPRVSPRCLASLDP
jgi:hypothetical protein